MENKNLTIPEIKKFVSTELSNKETLSALVATTFKGLDEINIKKAIVEGMMRGFEFKDFLQKNVYAIPFKDSYSLVTSIDYARKLGMRSGIVGTTAPVYEEKDGKIVSCTITVKKKVSEYIGDYSATVYFNEYTTNRNLWISKPRTMIAKVAEMHALRKACPEELSQAYSEEEIEAPAEILKSDIDTKVYEDKLNNCKSLQELREVFGSLPGQLKITLRPLADNLKSKFNENTSVSK